MYTYVYVYRYIYIHTHTHTYTKSGVSTTGGHRVFRAAAHRRTLCGGGCDALQRKPGPASSLWPLQVSRACCCLYSVRGVSCVELVSLFASRGPCVCSQCQRCLMRGACIASVRGVSCVLLVSSLLPGALRVQLVSEVSPG